MSENESKTSGLARYRAALAAGEVTRERLDPIAKARARPTSLRLAINGKCWDCQGGDDGLRARIRDCPITTCTLHPVRPYQRDDSEEE